MGEYAGDVAWVLGRRVQSQNNLTRKNAWLAKNTDNPIQFDSPWLHFAARKKAYVPYLDLPDRNRLKDSSDPTSDSIFTMCARRNIPS